MSADPAPLTVTYPPELPITARRDELLATIAAHQVVIVAGETGSGKSTQLPKLCLELGRGVDGLIGHTQPRRIAARSVAERVAEELGSRVGDTVGYAVRFTDKVGATTRCKVMTDGILLNELQRDRSLSRYDTIIVDEAHERSLNIDFILGYLKQLLPSRPDLKVIVTSATIDTERFAQHFADADGPAPVIEVSGRTFPVEVRYRPLGGDVGEGERDGARGDRSSSTDVTTAVVDAVAELLAEVPGDVLVFASGEREIRDTAEAIEALKWRDTEVLPLFARLSSAEQHRVFSSHPGRRVVIATNIAETSLTVPGIRSVVDPGTARISRYNKRTKVQRLPIEDISQASADQRAGRCGRVAPGVCIRLFAADDFDARPEFTEPEILRTNLASVILQMTALGLGDVESFPFVEPPDRRHVADGVALLEELGALQPDRPAHDRRLTEVGRRLARLPLDPTLGRMVLEAERNGCVHEVMVIAAALSIQDVRERPLGKEQLAAERHARFRVPGSDFLGMVALWDHLRARQAELGSSAFRREVKADYLHFVRIREWQDVYTQIRQVVRSLKLAVNTAPASEDDIHRSLLAGLIGNVGRRDDREVDTRAGAGSAPTDRSGRGRPDRRPASVAFIGVRNASFTIGRASVLARRPPRWVMAAELVETNQLWARTAATIQPNWIESVGRHLVKSSFGDPYWNAERGTAQVIERVHLRALTIVEGRAVNVDRIDRARARDLFILHALVRGEWETHHRFVAHNAERIAEVRDLEDRARRRDILVDEDVLFDFYAARVPDHVTDVRRFDRWWKDEVTTRPDRLDLRVEDLTAHDAGVDDEAFPHTVSADAGGTRIEVPVDYAFEPGDVRDGAIYEIPVAVLNRTDPASFDWLVPGVRHELVTHLLRALPKTIRRQLGPAPDRATDLLERIGPDDGPLRTVLADAVTRITGQRIEPAVWDDVDLPSHLRPWFRVTEDGETVAEGPDLAALERRLRAHVRATVVERAPDLERDGLTDWTIDTLPMRIETTIDGLVVEGYPSLIDSGDAVGVRILASPEERRALHWNGVRRLLTLALPRPARLLQRLIDPRVLLGLTGAPHGTVSAAADDALAAVLDEVMLDAGPLPFDDATYRSLRRTVEDRYRPMLVDVVVAMSTVVTHRARIHERMSRPAPAEWAPMHDDIDRQLDRLVFDGMAMSIGATQLSHLPRYLEAIDIRLDRAREGVASDRERMAAIHRLEIEHDALVRAHGLTAALDDVRWQIEEFRVQQFAQQLGTEGTVSAKRIRTALERVRRL